MGVLESVDLKQKNFPFRKKFEEFYSDFELLSPRFAQLRYYQMKQQRSPENWESLSREIMGTQMQGLGQEFYAIGRCKILMMPQIRSVLEKCKEKASLKRDASAVVLKEAFSVYFGAVHMKRKKRTMMFV